MVALLIAGIAAFTAGILALLFGIPIKDFSVGSTMIISGAVVASAGMLMIGMWILARELRALGGRGAIAPRADERTAKIAPSLPAAPRIAPEPAVIGDMTAPADADDDLPPLPKASWQEAEPAVAEPVPAKPKRNLLFASSSRRERERAAAKTADKTADKATEQQDQFAALIEPSPPAPPPPPPFDPAAAASDIPDADPRDSFENAWPQAEVARPGGLSRRRDAIADERPPVAPPVRTRPEPRPEPKPAPPPADVTVLKSGVVDGMAYSLYSDGSIEAQMPEGMVRFASIDELRAHLDDRA